jgi:hypothetical protein
MRQRQPPVREKLRQEAIAAAAAAATAKATVAKKAATTAAKEKERKAKEAQQAKAAGGSTSGVPTIAQHAQKTALPEDYDGWEISEGDLPEGYNLLGSKALQEEYPEDEANNKKNNPGKGKKGHPKN